MSIWIKKERPMFASTRRFVGVLAAAGFVLAPLAACLPDDSSAQSGAPASQPLVQEPVLTPEVIDQYAVEPQQQSEYVVEPSSDTEVASGTEAVISAATPREFEVPGDIAPGTYVFEPYSGMTVSFYMSAGFQKLPDIHLIDELTLVTVPEGILVIDHMQVFEPTEAQINGLPHIDLSDQ